MDKKYIIFARRLAVQTLNNIEDLSIKDIKRRLNDIIESLEEDKNETGE